LLAQAEAKQEGGRAVAAKGRGPGMLRALDAAAQTLHRVAGHACNGPGAPDACPRSGAPDAAAGSAGSAFTPAGSASGGTVGPVACASRHLRPLALRGGMQVWEHLVPSVTGIQILLESAWSESFDPPAATYFGGGRLLGKTIPIGATECAVILRYLGFRAVLLDLTAPCPETGVHQSLMELCRWWFLSSYSCRFPLYLQVSAVASGAVASGACRTPTLARSTATLTSYLQRDPGPRRA